ncbi:MAG: hypothetical protein IJS08_13345, partial [Victivallales bacterium]|nr:hypothetical protein [Victivallales bacterium]
DQIAKTTAQKLADLAVNDEVSKCLVRFGESEENAPNIKMLLLHAIKPYIDNPPMAQEGGRRVLETTLLQGHFQRTFAEIGGLLEEIKQNEELDKPQFDAIYVQYIKDTLFTQAGKRNEAQIGSLEDYNTVQFNAYNAKALQVGKNLFRSFPNDGDNIRSMIAESLKACGNNKKAMNTIALWPDKILVSGAGSLRSKEDVKKRIAGLLANYNEVNELGKDDPKVLKAGNYLLEKLKGKSLPPGMIAKLVQAMKSAPTDCIATLKPASSAAELHKAIMQYKANLDKALTDNKIYAMFDGKDDLMPCNVFLASIMLSRFSAEELADFKAALLSDECKKLQVFYEDASMGEFTLSGPASTGLVEYVQHGFGSLIQTLRGFHTDVQVALDEEPQFMNYGKNPPVLEDNEKDPITNELAEKGRVYLSKNKQTFLGKIVEGNGPAALKLRDMISKRVGEMPRDPEEILNSNIKDVLMEQLNKIILQETKKMLTAHMEDTQFAKDIAKVNVTLENGKTLSHDVHTACDEIAQYVTGRADATFDTLQPKEKNKVCFILTLFSQSTMNALEKGISKTIAPKDVESAFQGVNDDQAQGLALNFKLKFVDDKMTLNGRFVSPKKELVMHDGEKFELGEGSCINSKFEYNVFENEFKHIEEMDFTSLEDANFNALCTTNFSSKIN